MKILITTLTMIFTSFSASGKNVETYYKYCKPFQTNGYSQKGLTEDNSVKAIACIHALTPLMDVGFSNCNVLSIYRKNDYIDDAQFEILALGTANNLVSTFQLITSFISYAENNPDKFKQPIGEAAGYFLKMKF